MQSQLEHCKTIRGSQIILKTKNCKARLDKEDRPRIQRLCMSSGAHSKSPVPHFEPIRQINLPVSSYCNKVTTVTRNESKMNVVEQQTWANILTKTTYDNQLQLPCYSDKTVKSFYRNNSDFIQFDPMHTLQFLLIELNTRIKILLPEEKTIQKIITEIQNTVKRLSSLPTSTTIENSTNSLHIDEQPDIDFYGNEKQTHRTPICDTEIETKYRKIFKEHQIKEEEIYKLHDELCKSRKEVINLKNEIRCLKNKLGGETFIEKLSIHSLEAQYKQLKSEMQSMQKFLCEKQEHDKQIQRKFDKTIIDEDVVTKLEPEKLMVLLKSQENQKRDLQNELNDNQNLVGNQINLMYDDKMVCSVKNKKYCNSNNINNGEPLDKSSKNKSLSSSFKVNSLTSPTQSLKSSSVKIKDYHKKSLSILSTKDFPYNTEQNLIEKKKFITDNNDDLTFMKKNSLSSKDNNNEKEINNNSDEFKVIIDDVRLPSPLRKFQPEISPSTNFAEINFTCNFYEPEK